MRTFPVFMDGGTITWLAAIGYVVLLTAVAVAYTWIFSFVVRRRDARHVAEVHEVPRPAQMRKVA